MFIYINTLVTSKFHTLAQEIKKNKMATYEEVKDVPNHPEIYLIDVRNKNEVASSGTIPGSINIPSK